MKCISFIIFGLIAVASTAPTEPEKPIDPTQALTDFIANAQTKITEISGDIQKQLGINQDQIADVFKNQTSALVSNVQSYITTVSNELKAKMESPEVEKVWADLKTKIGKVAEDINANVPNAKESAELVQKKFTEGVQTIIRESNVIADALKENSGQVKEQVATFTKKAVDLAVEATQNLNKQLQAVAATETKA